MADGVSRTIVRDEGTLIELDAPLPDGFEATAIARYNDYGFVGWRNFRTIIDAAQRSLVPVFVWNITFAVSTIIINVAAGVLLAVLLNNPDLKFRNLYRTLLIIPWALPNIITIQVWFGFLNENFGAINRVLMLFDVTPGADQLARHGRRRQSGDPHRQPVAGPAVHDDGGARSALGHPARALRGGQDRRCRRRCRPSGASPRRCCGPR